MNNRDTIVLKKIIQYCEEIKLTMDRFSLSKEDFSKDFVVKYSCIEGLLQ